MRSRPLATVPVIAHYLWPMTCQLICYSARIKTLGWREVASLENKTHERRFRAVRFRVLFSRWPRRVRWCFAFLFIVGFEIEESVEAHESQQDCDEIMRSWMSWNDASLGDQSWRHEWCVILWFVIERISSLPVSVFHIASSHYIIFLFPHYVRKTGPQSLHFKSKYISHVLAICDWKVINYKECFNFLPLALFERQHYDFEGVVASPQI